MKNFRQYGTRHQQYGKKSQIFLTTKENLGPMYGIVVGIIY